MKKCFSLLMIPAILTGSGTLTVAAVKKPSAAAKNQKPAQMALGIGAPVNFAIIPGTYKLTWDPNTDCTSATRARCCIWDKEAEPMFKKLPTLVSSNPKFWVFRIDSRGDGLIGVIVDESKGTGKGYDRVYFDSNRDWDFSDEKPVVIRELLQRASTFTDWVTIPSAQGRKYGRQTNNPIQVRLAPYLDGADLFGTVRMKGTWRGQIRSNKGLVECAIIDSNSNGIYGDFMLNEPEYQARKYTGDSFCIDSRGLAIGDNLGYGNEAKGLKPVSQIGVNRYIVKPSDTGDKITIVKVR